MCGGQYFFEGLYKYVKNFNHAKKNLGACKSENIEAINHNGKGTIIIFYFYYMLFELHKPRTCTNLTVIFNNFRSEVDRVFFDQSR